MEVSEGSKEILARCGDTNRPLTVVSEGPSLNVTLTASDHVFPKRGYVAHYKGEYWGAKCGHVGRGGERRNSGKGLCHTRIFWVIFPGGKNISIAAVPD